jgi:quinol monooxygenase YgiN
MAASYNTSGAQVCTVILQEKRMLKFAFYVPLEAKGGKEGEVEAMLKSAQPLAMKESGTKTWYAFAESPGHYGIFDTFEDEAARQAHLDGPIAKILMQKADELLAKPPQIHKIQVLASK